MSAPFAKRAKGALGMGAARAGMFARDFRSKMLIVTFHRINDDVPEDGLTAPSDKFAAFCEFFRRYFKVLPLSEQVAGCRARRDMGGTLSITFDDGYSDNAEIAAPILRRFGLPATFFVITGFIGTRSVAPWDRDRAWQPSWMSWDQLRRLVSQGFEVGSHTHSHLDLGAADAATVRADLETSRRSLEEALGTATPLFAYPFGGRNNITAHTRQLVREAGFQCCASCYGGVNSRTPDPFELNRITIGQGFASPHQFGLDLLLRKV